MELSIKKSYVHLTEAEKTFDKIPYPFWDKNIQQTEYTQHVSSDSVGHIW